MTQHTGMVLGLTGRAGAGKNTVAEMLQCELGGEFKIVCEGFADSLKLSAARALGFDPADTREAIAMVDALKTCGSVSTIIEHGPYDVQEARISGRELLQRYGTESHRDVFGWDFWVDQVIPPGGFTDPDFDLKIITDLRFENEAQRIRKAGGLIWRVYRPGQDGADTHVSEAGIADDEINWSIFNDGTLDGLADRVRPLAAQLRRRIADHRCAATGFPTPTHMETASGLYFDILNPRAADVRLEDIAHHLARINRYTGASGRAISVGEHAILVAGRLQALGLPARAVLRGLHHDDHEAYTGDIGRPMKTALIKLGAPVKTIEGAIDEAIYEALQLPALLVDEAAAVKDADEWALSAESYHHMPSQGRDWTSDGLYGPNISFDVEGLHRLRDERGWDADTIQRIWLLWHHRLTQALRNEAA